MEETIQVDSRTYVLTSSSRVDNRTRVLKKDDTFAVYDCNGEMGKVGTGSLGLYCLGTRHLGQWEITVAGRRPLPLNSTIREDNSVFLVDSTTPDILDGEHPVLAKGTVHLRRELTVHDGMMQEELTVTNYSEAISAFELAYRFDADYRDIFEVRGMVRAARGAMEPIEITPEHVTLRYCGLDKISRETHVAFSQPAAKMTGNTALFNLCIQPGKQYQLVSKISCTSGGSMLCYPDFSQREEQRKEESSAIQLWTNITTDNEQFNEWLERSASDLRMLITNTKFGVYPYAGVPWFSTPFGRDGIITALQTLWVQPELSRGVLNFLAANQADSVDPINEAQPGKILHELREGEMAVLGEIPFRRYYGTVDATPLFVILAGRYFQRTGNQEFIESIWGNILRAVQWIEDYGDLDGDGFVEYARSTEKGLLQQGWKDSWNSIFHEDGTEAQAPIALCEVQAYVFEAYELGSHMAKALGHQELAMSWTDKAKVLKESFDQAFWNDELGVYVIALDAHKKQCKVRTSNAGHALYSGIAKPERAERLAQTLTSVQAFNGWGLRTVFHGEARYNPMSYHNGSVWPHDTAMAAFGLARYGYRDEAMLFMTGLYDASTFWELCRLPELFCGFTRREGQAPTNYPVACIPQAWAAGSVFMFLQATLGVEFLNGEPIVFRKPKLPPYINRLKISNLRYGDSKIDLVLQRRGSDVALHAENPIGTVDVAVLI